MAELELLISEENALAFDVEISGASTKNIDVRFIIETDEYEFSFPGVMSGKTVEVKIPILSKMIKPDVYHSRLQFVLEGEKYFVPMKSDVELIQPISVVAEAKGNKTSSREKNQMETTITVKHGKTLNERILDNLEILAGSKNLGELQKIYTKNIGDITNLKKTLGLIDSVCINENNVSFKTYIKKKK
jgi:hypothetical protein